MTAILLVFYCIPRSRRKVFDLDLFPLTALDLVRFQEKLILSRV